MKDLQANRGASIVIAGRASIATRPCLGARVESGTWERGATVIYTDPVEANPADEITSLTELVSDMRSGAVDFLPDLGGNPLSAMPADLNFLDALKKAGGAGARRIVCRRDHGMVPMAFARSAFSGIVERRAGV